MKAYARKTVEEEGVAAGVDESLERAQDELELLEEIKARQRRERIRAQAEYVAREVSPFGHSASGPVFSAGTATVPTETATDRQVNYLVYRMNWNRAAAQRLSKKAAGVIIGKHRR